MTKLKPGDIVEITNKLSKPRVTVIRPCERQRGYYICNLPGFGPTRIKGKHLRLVKCAK